MVNPRSLQRLNGSELTQLKIDFVSTGTICPILIQKLTPESAVVDHKHITKSDIRNGKTGEDGKGLLRGIIHDQANVFIGKIEKGFKRSGCHKFDISISDQLRHIADYLESPPMEQIYIHPNERIKPDTLNKRDFDKICKYWFDMFPRKRTLPTYPKGGLKIKIQKDGTKKKIYKGKKSPKWITWLNMANECALPKSKREIKRVK